MLQHHHRASFVAALLLVLALVPGSAAVAAETAQPAVAAHDEQWQDDDRDWHDRGDADWNNDRDWDWDDDQDWNWDDDRDWNDDHRWNDEHDAAGDHRGEHDTDAADQPAEEEPVAETPVTADDGDGSAAEADGNRRRRNRREWDDGAEDADWTQVADFAANNGGRGFWVLMKSGRLFGVEGAPQFDAVDASAPLIAMASHPWEEGLWLLDADGNVYALGKARDFGSADFDAVGIAAHRDGGGYWVAARDGEVEAFGRARHHGDASGWGVEVSRIVTRDDADGYYLRTVGDRWLVFPRPQERDDDRPSRDRDDDHDHDHDWDRPDRDKPNKPHKPRPNKPNKPTKPNRPTRPTHPVVDPPTSGTVRLATVDGITVSRRIADNLRRMLRASARGGVKLGGWGYRSNARQIELRREHCGPSKYAIYEMPSSRCKPPTARPGHSMHEGGLAIDFYKKGRNGQAISIAGTREFRWLKANARRFGFYNLPSEPWHWSVNGH